MNRERERKREGERERAQTFHRKALTAPKSQKSKPCPRKVVERQRYTNTIIQGNSRSLYMQCCNPKRASNIHSRIEQMCTETNHSVVNFAKNGHSQTRRSHRPNLLCKGVPTPKGMNRNKPSKNQLFASDCDNTCLSKRSIHVARHNLSRHAGGYGYSDKSQNHISTVSVCQSSPLSYPILSCPTCLVMFSVYLHPSIFTEYIFLYISYTCQCKHLQNSWFTVINASNGWSCRETSTRLQRSTISK